MIRVLSIVLGIGLLGAARAEEPVPTDGGSNKAGMAVIKRAAAAAKKAKVVKYAAEYGGTAWVKNFVPAVTAEVIVGEQSKWEINSFRADVTLKPYDKDETTKLVGGCDGNVFFLIDPAKKIVYEDMDHAVMGSNSRNIQRVVVPALGAPEPFADLLEAETIEVQGTKTVADEDCDEIRVVDKDGQESIWCFAKKDGLPRSVERIYKNNEGEKGTTQLVLTDLVVNPKLATSPFKAQVPDGYTKTDEFAP